MPRGDKSSYSSKQKRQAQHIESSEEKQGRSSKTAARIAWATVNKQDGGAKGSKSRKSSTSRSAGRSGGMATSRSRTSSTSRSRSSSGR